MRNQRKLNDLSHLSVSQLGVEPGLMITVTLAEGQIMWGKRNMPFLDYILVLKL